MGVHRRYPAHCRILNPLVLTLTQHAARLRLVRSAERRPVLVFGNTLSHLAPVFHCLLGNGLRFLHLNRGPVVTAASIFVKPRPAALREAMLRRRSR